MKKPEEKTNAIRILEQQGADFFVHPYGDALSGQEVAAALGQSPDQLFKTLVTTGKSGGHYVFLVPVSGELDLKKAATAVGEKAIEMLPLKELFPLTGYVHGGCSPIGMKKVFPTVVDETAQLFDTIFFSGGKIGLQIETSPLWLSQVVALTFGDITK